MPKSDGYTINYEYWKTHSDLSSSTDTPDIPARFHDVIVARAKYYIYQLRSDPQFTQFYANPIYLNPAFAGSKICPRFAMNYRNEWPSLTGNYVTYSMSYDQYFKNISGGIGVMGRIPYAQLHALAWRGGWICRGPGSVGKRHLKHSSFCPHFRGGKSLSKWGH